MAIAVKHTHVIGPVLEVRNTIQTAGFWAGTVAPDTGNIK